MALMRCPECAREVSDQAPACPHCGYPIVEGVCAQPVEQGSPAKPTERAALPVESLPAQPVGRLVYVIIIGCLGIVSFIGQEPLTISPYSSGLPFSLAYVLGAVLIFANRGVGYKVVRYAAAIGLVVGVFIFTAILLMSEDQILAIYGVAFVLKFATLSGGRMKTILLILMAIQLGVTAGNAWLFRRRKFGV